MTNTRLNCKDKEIKKKYENAVSRMVELQNTKTTIEFKMEEYQKVIDDYKQMFSNQQTAILN